MPYGIRIRRIRRGSGLLHSGNRDESQSIGDEKRKMLVNCIPPIRRDAFVAGLYMEAHRCRVRGSTAVIS